MTPPVAPDRSSEWIEWGVAGRPLPGETCSGDLHLVAPFDGGVLIALIDGLGHGVEAAEASRRAVEALGEQPGLPLRRLVERCHERLRDSRGAVMTLATLDVRADRLSWTGVGNVEAMLCRAAPDAAEARVTLLLRGGVVGYQLPLLRESALEILRGDVMVLATDGVRHEFLLESPERTSAQGYAEHLLERYGKSTDDALVLVVRYLGRSS